MKKAVDELVETYNGANPGRKRKFEELLYREEEIRERARAERAARSASGAAGGVARRRLVGVRQSKFGVSLLSLGSKSVRCLH